MKQRQQPMLHVNLTAVLIVLLIATCSNKNSGDENSDILKGENNRVAVGLKSEYVTTSEKDFGGCAKERVVLKKRYSDNPRFKNMPILDQKDFIYSNTIYVIQHDFILAENVVVPKNCILDFDGGSLRGGTITGNNTSIKFADYSIFNDCIVKNFNLPYVDPRWVGAVSDFNEQTNSGTDNSCFFQMAYDNIAANHPGLDIFILGKYLISKTVVMGMQCHLRGVHNNTRGIVEYGLHSEIGSSSSLIAVGDCVAFQVVGDKDKKKTWADFSMEHIKFLGLNRRKSIAIQYEASGAPTRPAAIEKCEACNLHYFLFAKANSNSTIGNLTISENNIYRCDKAIYAVSEPEQMMGFTALKIENNVIEHNGDKCIHLNKCFGPIIIDNNILEGESNPIYITSTYFSETNYVISYNYFEQPSDDDKKIHIDGYVTTEGGDYDHAYFLTNVEIYGNTSVHGFAVELSGVVIRRLDRIDTPTKGRINYSTFKNCLFEDIELSDVHVSQFLDWNISTRFPTSNIPNRQAFVGSVGSDLLSFDDCKGSKHVNKNSNVNVSISGDTGKDYNMLIIKIRPHFTPKNKKIFFNYKIDNKKFRFGAILPREIPYYAFLIYEKGKVLKKSNYELSVNAINYGTDIEMSSVTVYKNIDGPLYAYPHILIPFSSK